MNALEFMALNNGRADRSIKKGVEIGRALWSSDMHSLRYMKRHPELIKVMSGSISFSRQALLEDVRWHTRWFSSKRRWSR